MLTDAQLQLLTAYVDGELTPSQRQAASRLLHESSSARAFLGELQENSSKLRQLPKHSLPGDFAQEVARRLTDTNPRPTSISASRGWRGWHGMAVAAALLLALAGSLYFFRSTDSDTKNRPGPQAKKPTVDPWLGSVIDGAVQDFVKPVPPGLMVAFRDLEQKPQRERLTQELKKETAFHLEVAVVSQVKAIERINDVFKDQGIKVLIDARAKEKLQKEAPRQEFVVYAENIEPEELTAILQQLHVRPLAKNGSASPFDSLWLTNFTTDDQKQLAGMFGLPPEQFQPAKKGDDDKLFQGTIIEKSKVSGSKKGEQPKAVRLERYAVVMTGASQPGGALSAEVKTFLANRRQHRPGTLQVLVVLQPAEV